MRYLRAHLTIAVICLGPIAALADMTCTFPTECIGGEACADSGYSVSINTALSPGSLAMEGGLPEGDSIITDAETIPITWTGAKAALAAFGNANGQLHLLSVSPDGEALYSVHVPSAGIAIVYLGTCEAT